jgi:acetyl esterase/lipase
MSDFHPDLRKTARFLPKFTVNSTLRRIANWVTRFRGVPKPPIVKGLSIKDVHITALDGTSSLRIRLYRPENAPSAVPALLWLHSGGFMTGSSETGEAFNIERAQELGIVVAAVDYRLAPEHPFPTPLDDCYAALLWLHSGAEVLGISPDKIAVGGDSAGGGLAAALAQLAHDREQVPVAFQVLIYPMLDDRTALRTDIDTSKAVIWTAGSNAYGWSCYLGSKPGGAEVFKYAAPARREDLSGLPPAWIGVGSFDVLRDEGVLYANRLRKAGVSCDLQVVEGAYHGFDVISPKANVVRKFRESQEASLRRALFPGQS